MSFFDCFLSLSLLSAIKTMCFAYAKIQILFYLSLTLSVSNIASFTTFSKAMLNKIGDNASLCFSLIVTFTVFDSALPFFFFF